MSSVRPYFNTTLYRKHLTRFWPLWALYFLIWFFSFPVYLILQIGSGEYFSANALERFSDLWVLDALPAYGLVIAALMGMFTSMAIWSYLFNSRASGMAHALPIRREGLFLTGYLAGITFFTAPNLLIFLLTAMAELFAGCLNLGALALWFAAQTLLCLFFFSFGTLCASVTGHLLAVPAFFVIGNGLAMGLFTLIENALSKFLYGYHGIAGAANVARLLSPFYALFTEIDVTYRYIDRTFLSVTLRGLPMIVIYALVGLVLSGLALLFYRRRPVEKAGEVVTDGVLRPVFRYGFAFCGAITFGNLLYEIFGPMLGSSPWAMLFFMLLCGFWAYLAAEMMLQKSFRVWKRSWKGCLAFLAALVLLTVVIELDLTGYEKRLPDARELESVTLKTGYSLPRDSWQGNSFETSDPELMARVLALHQSVINRRKELEQLKNEQGAYAASAWDGETEIYRLTQFNLTYSLKNGGTMTRAYWIPVTQSLLDDAGSPPSILLELLNQPDRLKAGYFPETITAEDFVGGSLSFYFSSQGYYEEIPLTAEQAGILYKAALADLQTGRLGRRFLLENEEYVSRVYSNKLTLTFYGVFPGWTRQDIPGTFSVQLMPQTDSIHLITALKDLGLINETYRLTLE